MGKGSDLRGVVKILYFGPEPHKMHFSCYFYDTFQPKFESKNFMGVLGGVGGGKTG